MTNKFSSTRLAQQTKSIEHLPSALITALTSIIEQPQFNAVFSPAQVEQLLSIEPNQDTLLRSLVPLAQTYSHAPISSFYVGAVALGASGAIYLGANLEFSRVCLNQTVHAEQSVITNAWSHGETSITQLAISAAPCGHCRQFINELTDASQMTILLPEQPITPFKQLLPQSFGPDDLDVSDRLMASAAHTVNVHQHSQLIDAAVEATRQSYSPYSRSPSGVALATKNGIFTGRYAENCAYNPSLSPLQGALICLHLAGESFDDISDAILVEQEQPNVSQYGATAQLLEQLGAKPPAHLTF